MATTYSGNIGLGAPATGDTGWGPVLNANATTLDGLAPIGGLCCTTAERPSASLNVKVAAGSFVQQDGTVTAYAGTASQAVAASSTKVLYLDLAASNALTVAASFPATPHVRIATVVTGTASITSITDARATAQHAGQRLPVVTHLLSTAAAIPTIAAGTAAGTSPTVSIGSNSTDVAGLITVTTGTSPAAGILATVTFNVAFATAPRAVLLTPANSAAAGVAAKVFQDAPSILATAFTVNAGSALTASTSYKWSYVVVG